MPRFEPAPAVALAVCLIWAAPVFGERLGVLAGLIRDPSGAAAGDTLISVVNEDTGFRRTSVSQADGSYLISSLPPGAYKITVRHEGFRTVIRFGVRVEPGRTARVDFTLTLGSMQETITVEGSPAALTSDDASVGTLVERDRIENLPLNGRGLLSLVELAPGTVATPATRGDPGQFTTNGQRPNTHYFTVDGVSVNNGVSGGGLPAHCPGGSLPGMTAIGSFHSLASLDALEELRVQTSTVTPEMGRLPGAQVSLTTRSGTNSFHGVLFEYFRHEKLDANDWFANRHGDGRAPLRLNDFGAALGGPIRRDRAFFFLSYESLRLRQPSAWRAVVPSTSTGDSAPDWLRPVLDLYPRPNGPELGGGAAEWTGRNTRPSRLSIGSLRLDYALAANLTAFARYNEAPSSSEFGSPQVNHLSIASRSATAGLDVRITPRMAMDLRVNTARSSATSAWQRADSRPLPPCYLAPATAALTGQSGLCESFFRFSIAGAGEVVYGSESDTAQKQWNLVEVVTLNRGTHNLRFGADYLRLSPRRSTPGTSVSVLAETMSGLPAGRDMWVAVSGAERLTTVVKTFSAFAQDTWRVTPRLTLNYGLRWEFDPAPVARQNVYGLDQPHHPWTDPAGIPLWPLRYSNFAPRLGVAYRPTPQGRTVIRAGLGLYYDSSLSVATDLVNGGPLNVSLYSNPATQPTFPARMILSYGFTSNLRLPLVEQWNASLEHSLSGRDVVTAGYVGSSGHHLLRREMGGPESTELVRLAMATNHGSSIYHGLNAQYRRRIDRGLQALVAYAWSHSIDTASADSALHWTGSGLTPELDRASSDFDVRHSLSAALTYDIARKPGSPPALRWMRGWSVDGILRARTGFPVNVLNAEQTMGLSFANIYRPDLVPGAPVWLADPAAPGGRRLNRAAFQPRAALEQGNLGRNAVAGFGMSQLDLSMRRDFAFTDQRALQLRVEVFNALNHANPADPVPFLVSPLFGQSPSLLNLMLGTGSPGSGLTPMLQAGGARSVQVALRFRF